MSLEENKAIVRRFIEAYNKRNLDVFEELVAPDYIDRARAVVGMIGADYGFYWDDIMLRVV